MTRVFKSFEDSAEALALLIASWFPELANPTGQPEDFRVGRNWPPDFRAGQYACRVRDIGGSDDRITDVALIDVDLLAPTFDDARRIAGEIRARVVAGRHRAPNGVVLDRGRTAMRPQDMTWDDDSVARVYASYQVSARR